MSRIDELQRLHEAATPGEWVPGDDGTARAAGGRILVDYSMEWPNDGTAEDLSYIVALHNSWPAIHRVLVAARGVVGPHGFESDRKDWAEFVEALRALDGGLPADQ